MRLNPALIFRSLWLFIRNHRIELFLLLLLAPSIFSLLQPGYFSMHDDLQVFRLFQLNKCFADGQIPCRWVPDAGYGYGYPLMQFYPPMPYYPMQLMVYLGLGFFWPVKIMFILSLLVSGFGMYYLARQFFPKIGALISSLFYVYAPYHAVDVYVRGAQNEAWGMAWFPFVLLFIYKIIAEKFSWKNFLLFALTLSFQLTSHNVMTLVFAPSALVWAIFWLIKTKRYKSIRTLFFSGLLAVGLSAFFFIPVVFEQKYVHVDSMTSGYFNYMAHYATLFQLFISRFWAYGGSTFGTEDGMSFGIGLLQWIIALVSFTVAVFRFKKDKWQSSLVIMSVVFAFGYTFLTHGRSLPIWQRLTVLQYAQFPWRLVALSVFYFSFLGGYLFAYINSNLLKRTLFAVLALSVIGLNVGFFHIERPVRVTLNEKMGGKQWVLQVTGGIFDYLPRTAVLPPGDPAFSSPLVIEGTAGIINHTKGTSWHKFTARVSSDNAKIMLPLFSFPGLSVKVNGNFYPQTHDPDLGRVIISLPKGDHNVDVRIGYTPLRLLSDLITLVSILVVIKLISYARKQS